jgi:hypothetical protein
MFALIPSISHKEKRNLRPYFATPFGDMMIAGCFGLLAATAEILPELKETILSSLNGTRRKGATPWENL